MQSSYAECIRTKICMEEDNNIHTTQNIFVKKTETSSYKTIIDVC